MTIALFSIVTPVYNTPLSVLAATINSVLAQTFDFWQLVLVDDLSTDVAVRDLLQDAAAREPRITLVLRAQNGGIAEASNDGVSAAVGEFIVLLDHDDLLHADALATVATALAADRTIDYLYTDEDKVDADGSFYEEFRKPDWSPERLRSQMYCGHLSVLRTEIVRAVGGFDSSFDGSQDHDLVLKVTERARRVSHIPEVLYHWRSLPESTASSGNAKPYAWDAGVRAVQAHVDRVGIDATVTRGDWFGTYSLVRHLSASTSVSVILAADSPEQGGNWPVVNAVRALTGGTRHPSVQFVVVSAALPPRVLAELEELCPGFIDVRCEKTAGFSERCNLGALASSGELLVFFDDGLDPLDADIVSTLAAVMAQPGVGMAGPCVVGADGRIVAAGHNYAQRRYLRALVGSNADDPGPFSALRVDREASGLDTDCFAIRRSTFVELGGFCEALPPGLCDVDLSLKVRSLGKSLIWLERPRIRQRAARERSRVLERHSVDLVRSRWGSGDPQRAVHDV